MNHLPPLPALAAFLLAIAPLFAAPKAEPPPAGKLTIESTPPQAEILIDRKERGQTPATLTLAPGKHLVAVRLAGHRTEYRTVPVDNGGQFSVNFDLKPLTGIFLAHSVPSGAEVTIDGINRGKTPLLLTELPLGVHRAEFSFAGYRSKTVEIKLVDRAPVKEEVELTSITSTLDISCPELTGTDVAISINGVPRPNAPCTIDRIPAGVITLEAKAEGFKPWKQTLTLAEGERQSIEIALEIEPAVLKVVSIPDKTRVYVDNEFRGETPIVLKGIVPGEHRVRVEKAGHEPTARTLTLEAGKTLVEEFRLASNTGRCILTTEPDGVTVFLDGKELGKTPTAEGQSLRASAPFPLEEIPEGTHVLKFVRPGYFEASKEISVKRGETNTLHVALRRRFIPNYEVVTASGVHRGVFVSAANGVIRLELKPGVTMSFNIKDSISHRRLPDSVDTNNK